MRKQSDEEVSIEKAVNTIYHIFYDSDLFDNHEIKTKY